MIVIISPAKKLDYESDIPDSLISTIPLFEKQAVRLRQELANFSPEELQALMRISSSIAQLTYERNIHSLANSSAKRAAIMSFDGAQYESMQPREFSKEDIEFAQFTVRILSGLYGVLSPMDLIEPYRLEMATKLKVGESKDLYNFWRETLTDHFIEQCALSDNTLINLASSEYSKVLDMRRLSKSVRIVTPIFKDNRGGGLKIISILAKQARGMMVNFIVKGRIDNLEALKEFSCGGYVYDHELSNDEEWVFVR
ncbi:MAG: peroxide stress protein YaaA [Bacteroidales bacterium]